MSPHTENAGFMFGRAIAASHRAAFSDKHSDLAKALNLMANGLQDMASGLSATYELIAEVKALMQAQSAQQRTERITVPGSR